MPKLTPEELHEAKRQRAAEREAQAAAERQALEKLEQQAKQRRAWLATAQRRRSDLASVLDGLYEELRELNKKWPTHAVTQRTVERVNKALATARDLLKDEDDEFLDGLTEIVAAGDLPETRDVVMTLREAKDAVARFRRRYQPEWNNLDDEEDEYDEDGLYG